MRHFGAILGSKMCVFPYVFQYFLKIRILASTSLPKASWDPRSANLGRQKWSRAPQERPRDPQEEPKSAPERPKSDPRAAQEWPKSGPRAAKSGPRATKSDPRAAKRGPRASQNCEDGLKSGQEGPKTAPDPPKGAPRPPRPPPGPPQMRPKRLQDRSKSVKFAPRASKSSRDVERKVENKHLNLKSETHAQNRQRGAARDERSEDLESEVRPTTPTKNRLRPKGNPKSSRTTLDIIVSHIRLTVCRHSLHAEDPC